MKRGNELHTIAAHAAILLGGGAMVLSLGMMTARSLRALTLQLPESPAPQLTAPAPMAPMKIQGIQLPPLVFEENRGQANTKVLYGTRSGKTRVSFLKHGVVFGFENQALQQRFIGANTSVVVAGVERAQTISNYLIGNDAKKWKKDIRNFHAVQYQSLYPGIDLEYFSQRHGELSYQYTLAPGASVANIKVSMQGAKKLMVEDQGSTLTAKLAEGQLQWKGLEAYQEKGDTRIPVTIAFELRKNNEYGFALGEYDPALPLIIDPTVDFATYVGGSGAETSGGMALDATGNIYISGNSDSANYPVSSAYQGTNSGSTDIVITKFNPSGTAVLYSTYLGGTSSESACDMTLDSAGNIYVISNSTSTDFPVANAAQSANAGSNDITLTKLDASGATIQYSTYLGGTGAESCIHIDVNSANEPLISGYSPSTDFPTINAYQSANGGGNDVVLAKYSSTGTRIFSTYLGGTASEFTPKANYDAAGNIYVVGRTSSSNFPLVNPYQGSIAGGEDSFAAKFNPSGSTLLYSTFIGGSGQDLLGASIPQSDGSLLISGGSASTNFPVTTGAYQTTYGGTTRDCVVLKLNPAGNALLFSTYIGGNGFDTCNNIDADTDGNIYFIGNSASTNFPLVNAVQGSLSGGQDLILGKLSANGSSLLYSTYYGGTAQDTGLNVVIDSVGRAVYSGTVASTNFPVAGAYQGTFGGGSSDLYLMRVTYSGCLACTKSGGDSTIPAPRLALSWPNGFERVKGGEEVQLRWLYQTLDVGTKINVSLVMDAGKLVIPVIQGVDVGDSEYFWYVPTFEGDTFPAKIRIEATDHVGNVLLSDESDYYFDIIGKPAAPPMPQQETQPEPQPEKSVESIPVSDQLPEQPTEVAEPQPLNVPVQTSQPLPIQQGEVAPKPKISARGAEQPALKSAPAIPKLVVSAPTTSVSGGEEITTFGAVAQSIRAIFAWLMQYLGL